MILTKQELLESLQDGIVTVTFTKVNGEVRTMPCTLREDIVPPRSAPAEGAETKTKKKNDGVISAWCIDKGAWRSFRYDSIVSLQFDGSGQ